MTNAPFILNVDCDMFANNHKVMLHGMCLLLGFDDERSCGYAQTPQKFYGGLENDPFGNQLEFVTEGMAGIQGPFYGGTGSFHRRKIIYGSSPFDQNTNSGWASSKELRRIFGNSNELLDSTNEIIKQEAKGGFRFINELSSRTEIAKHVASSTFENNTSWGKEIGWMYGSMTEDILTGLRIQSMGWKSTFFNPNPPAFLGCAPTGGPSSLTQYKRWATGLLEILFDKDNSPVVATLTKQLQFRQCLCYLRFNIWALQSVPELLYSLLPACCLITGTSFLPKVRVSALMTNAPFILNVDCDMFANNHKVMLHGMCLLLGFDDERSCGYAQTPQMFYGGLENDPFGNQLEVLQKFVREGMVGIQGPFYGGTGSFHRRKIIYGSSPFDQNTNAGWASSKELRRIFGNSNELIDSANEIIKQEARGGFRFINELSSRTEIAKHVASFTFEHNTSWGKEIGWMYGSMTEDNLTGLRIQSMGWKSTFFKPNPPAFLGCAPTGGPASLTQYKRWATGLLEILFDKENSPVVATLTKQLQFRQCLCYIRFNIWALQSVPELLYSLLPVCCLITGTSFMPKLSEGQFMLVAMLFVCYNLYNLAEYKHCGKSWREWWNNQRMKRITAITAFLPGFLSVVFKLLGISETVFEVTRKDQVQMPAHAEPGRFTFDGSPIFITGTMLVLVHITAIGVALVSWAGGAIGPEKNGPGVGEMVCSGWVLISFWPFVRGLFGKGSYGIPWTVVIKAGVLAVLFLQLCRSL